jgi:hypothetical protein
VSRKVYSTEGHGFFKIIFFFFAIVHWSSFSVAVGVGINIQCKANLALYIPATIHKTWH